MLRRRRLQAPVNGSTLVTPLERAGDAWDRLVATSMVRRGGNQLLVMDGPGARAGVAAVWPLSQVLAAALDLEQAAPGRSAPARVDDLAGTVELYRRGDGYAPYPASGERYYDDNAWLGLDFVQAHHQDHGPEAADSVWLHKAKRTFDLVAAGQDPDGGVRWVEGGGSRNTCSTAPAIALALRLHRITGSERFRAFAERSDEWLWATLARPDGLFADHVEADGGVDDTAWAYNQGTPVGADVLWFRVTGDHRRLARATRLAGDALDFYAVDDRLWGQPPAFVSVFFRNLLTLHAAEAQPRVVAELDRYLERVWHDGRDPGTGRFVAGGIGHYDDGGTLDHAALVQLFALQAFDRSWLAEVS
ncbi:MAG TPA: glycoside hydrolase family 76 protein [Acidimicrobiales bacterium]